MRGTTRGIATLIGVAVAGALIWGATQVAGSTLGDYWGVIGLLAAAGLALALSQLLGGWTKWGWPRVSLMVLLLGFLPTLIMAGWIILNAQPTPTWTQSHIHAWSGHLGIHGFVHDMASMSTVVAFGLGLVFGFIFDTTGPRTEPVFRRRRAVAAPAPQPPPEPAPRPAPESSADTESTRVQRSPRLRGRIRRRPARTGGPS